MPIIGITLFPGDADDVTAPPKNAYQAMYAAKKEGRSRFQYYTPLMQSAADRRMHLSHDTHRAVLEKQFEVYYRPISDLATGAIVKPEALFRWHRTTI